MWVGPLSRATVRCLMHDVDPAAELSDAAADALLADMADFTRRLVRHAAVVAMRRRGPVGLGDQLAATEADGDGWLDDAPPPPVTALDVEIAAAELAAAAPADTFPLPIAPAAPWGAPGEDPHRQQAAARPVAGA